MRLVGRAISVLAGYLLGDSWASLAEELRGIYHRYLFSLGRDIPPIVVTTLIAAEDHRFFKHGGVDLIAIARALWNVGLRGRWDGASTIEQQLVRTVTRRYERTLRRKTREVLLATLVHKVIPKADIPGVYLSVAYFGWRMSGIQQACGRLGIKLRRASPRQAAAVVARLKYPEPKAASESRARQIAARVEHILRISTRRSWAITQARRRLARDAPVSALRIV